MIKNYLAVAFRNMRQQPLYAVINIASLTIGIAAALIIYIFVSGEKSFDRQHTKGDRILRLNETQNFTGTNFQKVALTGSPFGPSLQKDYPEIEMYTRFWGRGKRLMINEDKRFVLEQVVGVDSTFFEIFDFELLAGDRSTLLDEPNTIVLTETTARKFFDDPLSAVGNMVTIGKRTYKVTGVMKEPGIHSHLQFDAAESIVHYTRENPKLNTDWGSNFLTTYLLMKPNTNVKAFESKLNDWLVKFTGEKDVLKAVTLYVQPLHEVHADSTDVEHDYFNHRKFNGSYFMIFVIAGIFILIIASVNFMNLTTARASYRAKEVGVRQAIGARRNQVFTQFILESVLLSVIAGLLAVALTAAAIPGINNLAALEMSIQQLVASVWVLPAVLILVLILGLLSGIYPGLFIAAIKGSIRGLSRQSSWNSINRSLVVIQFGLALAMMVSTLVVMQQLNFMRSTDTGFTKDQMLLVDLNQDANKAFVTLKNEISQVSHVKGVTASGQRMGNNFHQWGFKIKADTGIVEMSPSNVNVEYDFLQVYGIELKDGRTFSKDQPQDNGRTFIINESFARAFSLKAPVGMKAGHGNFHADSLGSIIGVVKDFNFNSLHFKINNLVLSVHPDWGYDEMSIRFDAAHAQDVVAAVKEIWDAQVPTYPFTYSFLSDHFDNLYRSDKQMSVVVSLMAGLAIVISCMGLFGLALLTTERRTKEIGIRKVLGASEVQIVTHLSSGFMRLILVAFLLAAPGTWYLLSRWLEGFAYRIGVNPLAFVAGGVITLLIAFGTIGYQAFKASRANPVNALRYE